MALLSGEVETGSHCRPPRTAATSSGWLCYPGKLKPDLDAVHHLLMKRSGWLCYPGKLKLHAQKARRSAQLAFRMALLSGEVETRPIPCLRGAMSSRSGWLCYPGKLKPCWAMRPGMSGAPPFRMALLSGEVETIPSDSSSSSIRGSGWLCYPGKLKREPALLGAAGGSRSG